MTPCSARVNLLQPATPPSGAPRPGSPRLPAEQAFMKNFIRALRSSWPYRGRFLLSLVCAIFAAILWGLNFTAIYPVLKILSTKQSLQEWVDERIAVTQKDIS